MSISNTTGHKIVQTPVFPPPPEYQTRNFLTASSQVFWVISLNDFDKIRALADEADTLHLRAGEPFKKGLLASLLKQALTQPHPWTERNEVYQLHLRVGRGVDTLRKEYQETGSEIVRQRMETFEWAERLTGVLLPMAKPRNY